MVSPGGPHEKADMPHAHEESHAPQGPTTYALSFAVNGGSTSVITSFQTVEFRRGGPASIRVVGEPKLVLNCSVTFVY